MPTFCMKVCDLPICQKVSILANLTAFVPEITYLSAFSKFRKVNIIVVMLVCPSAIMEQLGSHWTAFHENSY